MLPSLFILIALSRVYLALGETTPGPLIMAVSCVGFVGGSLFLSCVVAARVLTCDLARAPIRSAWGRTGTKPCACCSTNAAGVSCCAARRGL